MKIKNSDILSKAAGLKSMGGKKLPYALARAISRNIEMFEKEIKLIESERIKICEEHAVKDDNGNPVIKDNIYTLKDVAECNEKLNELFNTEVEVNVVTVLEEIVSKCDEAGFDSLTVEEAGIISSIIK